MKKKSKFTRYEIGLFLQDELRNSFITDPHDGLFYFAVNVLNEYLGIEKTEELLREVKIDKKIIYSLLRSIKG